MGKRSKKIYNLNYRHLDDIKYINIKGHNKDRLGVCYELSVSFFLSSEER